MSESRKLPSLRDCVPNAYGFEWITSSDQFASRGTFVPLSFIDICEGDDSSAQIFSQIMYWFTPTQEQGIYRMKISIEHDGQYWLAKSHGEWFKETRIRRTTAKRAVKYLTELGLIELKYYEYGGIAQVPHYRIIWEEFERRMRIWKDYQVALMTNPKAKALEEDKYNDFLKLFAKATPDQNDSPQVQNDPLPNHFDPPGDQNDSQYILPIDFPEIPQRWKKIDDDARGEILLLIHGQRFHGKKRLGKFEYLWEKLLPVAKRPDPMGYMGVWAKVEAHDYWLTYQRAYPQAERLSARNAVDIWQDIEQMTSMDVMPAEIEQVIAWRITPKRKQPYKFEYLLTDIKALRERDKIDDPDLELAICKVFKVQAGDFTKRLARFFEGKDGDLPAWNLYRLKDNPMTARELAAFKRWYDDDERYDNQETPPTTAANLRDKIDLFRASPNHAARVERAQTLLDQWLGVTTPPPVLDGLQPDAEFAAQIDADVANFATMFSGSRR